MHLVGIYILEVSKYFCNL